jgi:hypothetical protein
MASLKHAMLMLRKLNICGIPRDIKGTLRQLRDDYSEELSLDGSDTSSQGSIKQGELEENNVEEGKEWEDECRRSERRTNSQPSEGE